MTGKISIFGGLSDREDSSSNMAARGETSAEKCHHTEGLSLYEHAQADLWPGIFLPRSKDLTEGTFRRLRPDALYFAYRFGTVLSKDQLRRIPWIFHNRKTGKRAMAHLVDRGPSEDTGRVFDISPQLAALLEVGTDDELEGFPLT